MRRNWMKDLKWLESTPTSSYTLQTKLSEVLYNSYSCRARVETVNQETGEYRIVLQGTIDCCGEDTNTFSK